MSRSKRPRFRESRNERRARKTRLSAVAQGLPWAFRTAAESIFTIEGVEGAWSVSQRTGIPTMQAFLAEDGRIVTLEPVSAEVVVDCVLEWGTRIPF